MEPVVVHEHAGSFTDDGRLIGGFVEGYVLEDVVRNPVSCRFKGLAVSSFGDNSPVSHFPQ